MTLLFSSADISASVFSCSPDPLEGRAEIRETKLKLHSCQGAKKRVLNSSPGQVHRDAGSSHVTETGLMLLSSFFVTRVPSCNTHKSTGAELQNMK